MPTVPEHDTTDVIQAALNEAGIDAEGEITPEEPVETTEETPEETPETTESVETPETTETPEVTDETIEEDAEAVKAAAAKATNQDEFDALCDELGFRLPKPGQKENRIPQSRVRARVKTAIKKYAEKFGLERNELTGKLTKADGELQTFRRADALIAAGANDPVAARRYLEMLAAIHPAYKQFLGPAEAVKTVPQALKDLGPKPGPDLTYSDGTKGFSDEQLEKRDEWLVAKARIEAAELVKQDYEQRFGPIESEHRQRTLQQQEAPKIAARINAIREQWGDLFIEQEAKENAKKGSSEIAQYQALHPDMPFEQVVTAVLLPKVRLSQSELKLQWIADMNRRKKVAGKTTSQQTRTVAQTGPKSTEDVIKEELAKVGL